MELQAEKWLMTFSFFFLLLGIFLIYVSNVSTFPGLLSRNPHPHPTLGHWAPTGPRASAPTDVQQGHPLSHMWPEPWVAPYVLFGWWCSPWELWGVWLVDTVVPPPPMELQTPSAPSVPFLTPTSGSPTLSPMVGYDHCPLYLSGSDRASQEIAISGFYHKALPGIHNTVRVS